MTDPGMREYRKGNWTVSETMVLIEAKKMDDERRTRRSIGLVDQTENRNKPAELRWKWIEDYCWRKGCLRSQNQCNDKWDNLMRDFKKVREYERRRVDSSLVTSEGSASSTTSYWKLEKSERKDRSLPSNMLPQIYDALLEVVEKKDGGQSQSQRMVHQQSLGFVHQPVPLPVQHQISPPPTSVVLPIQPPLPLPPPQAAAQPVSPPPASFGQPILPTADSDTSEYSDSPPAKRRRRTGGGNAEGEAAAGTSGGAAAASDFEVDAAISKSAFIIAEALRASEEGQDKRHRDLVSLQERRLKIEESKAEMNRQGMDGLVDAINKLAKSIFALASSHNNQNQQGGP